MSTYYITQETLPNGYTVKTRYDDSPESPREWDNAGTVVLVNSCRYDFGDETADADTIRAIMADPAVIALPVYMYDHSGITINTTGFSCGWDSGMVGCIYISKTKAVQEWGKKICTAKVRTRAIAFLRGEIETLDQYITGTVYAFEVYDRDNELVDSCFGYYGHESDCFRDGVFAANALADHEDKAAAIEAAESLYWAERDCVTL